MQKTVCLVPDRLHYIRMTVARAADTDAANGVQVFFAGNIIEINSLGPNDLQCEWRWGGLTKMSEEKRTLIHIYKAKQLYGLKPAGKVGNLKIEEWNKFYFAFRHSALGLNFISLLNQIYACHSPR
jgi:hypothetical protein